MNKHTNGFAEVNHLAINRYINFILANPRRPPQTRPAKN